MRWLRQIRAWRNSAQPLIEIRISRSAILDNYRAFKNMYGLPIAPVLKSNAYGHGLIEIAEIVEAERPPMIVVDSSHEARLLRLNGVSTPILVVGYTRASVIARSRLKKVSFTITSLDGLKEIAAKGSAAKIHIKFDTGMHRQGIPAMEIDEVLQVVRTGNLNVEGICSHFADADGTNEDFTNAQITRWNACVFRWRNEMPSTKCFHIAATAGSAFTESIDATMIRLGTGLYGFPRHASQTFSLRPALSMHTVLTGVKDLAEEENVGYNITYTAKTKLRIATVPVGYFEGVDRRLSNRGVMMVGDVACPIIGRVSMNISTIDVSDVTGAQLEAPVVVFSDKKEDPNSVAHVAALCDTTPLEILVHIPQHLRRIVV